MAVGQWKEPAVEEVKTLMSSVVVDRANTDDRVARTLTLEVLRFRGIIGRSNVLSDNPNEVPPEAVKHVLVLTIVTLISGTPNFQFVIKGADGSDSGFGSQVRQAERWLDEVQRGVSVTYPSNPDTGNHIESVRWESEPEIDTTSA